MELRSRRLRGLTLVPKPRCPDHRERRPLINRRRLLILIICIRKRTDVGLCHGSDSEIVVGAGVENRALIPFDELMLIETLGVGRVSTIYRAAWQRPGSALEAARVQVVALSRYGRYYDS
jgi:hypothetical protein